MDLYPVIWSPTAKLTYYDVLQYLKDNWTQKELNAFISRTEEVINYISVNPLLYQYSKDSDTHKCVIVKQLSLFYRVKASQVELLIFWDNRLNPSTLKF